jgi:hypothetical protein
LAIVETNLVSPRVGVHGPEKLVGSQHGRFPPIEGSVPIRIETVEEDHISRAAKVGLKQDGIRFPADNLHAPGDA